MVTGSEASQTEIDAAAFCIDDCDATLVVEDETETTSAPTAGLTTAAAPTPANSPAAPTPTAPTPTLSDNTTKLATTEYVKNQTIAYSSLSGKLSSVSRIQLFQIIWKLFLRTENFGLSICN